MEFLEDVAGKDVVQRFTKDYKEDDLDLQREFEIKKKTFGSEMKPNDKIRFRIPLALYETFTEVNGTDFRRSLIMKQDLKDQVSFAGDKLTFYPKQIKGIFKETCNQIVQHLRGILAEPAVRGTDTILMVGGFSESKMLQDAIRQNFHPSMRIIIPEDAGLGILMGAVIFGHNPSAIISRVARFTYGVKVYKPFNSVMHPAAKKVVIDEQEKCRGCFDKHVEVDHEVTAGMAFGEKTYRPSSKDDRGFTIKIFTSDKKNPAYIDDVGCRQIGSLEVDMADIRNRDDRHASVKMIYGQTELDVEARIEKTGKVLRASFDFLS